MVTAQTLNGFLKGTPLAGQGGTFIAAGRRNGVDPALLVSIAGAESSFGKQAPAGTFNPFGWGPNHQFGSWQEAINNVAHGLRVGYLDQGLTTPAQIQGKWAPEGAANDPTGLNSNWTRNVEGFLQKLGGSKMAAGLGAVATAASPAHVVAQPDAGAQFATSTLNQIAAGHFNPQKTLASLAALQSSAESGAPAFPVQVQGRVTNRVRGVVNLAREYLGTAYTWGGESPQTGFDCSGLLQWVYAKQGVQIPRDTYSQFQTGKPVSKGGLRPGDAVFFTGSDPKGGLPGHVGIYIGGGRFIESPHSGAVVRISKLAGRSDFVGGRRYA